MKTEGSFTGSDGFTPISYTLWAPEGRVSAVLQIIHGMSEYIDRYEDFALYLNSCGIAVAGDDHMGHGRTAKTEDDKGWFGEKDGMEHLTADEELMHHLLKEKYPGLPVHVLGHSMGSFIIRSWMACHGKNSGKFIIMGTSGSNPALGAGMALISVLRFFCGSRMRSRLVSAIAFGSYNKRVDEPRTVYDWLSRDTALVDAYVADPDCGFLFTLAGYADMFRLLDFVNDNAWYSMVPKNHPILVVSGREDPVGAYGQGPEEVCRGLRSAGCSSVELKLFEDMRHEILNELGKEEVYAYIRDFLIS